jgi:hypothetical protein
MSGEDIGNIDVVQSEAEAIQRAEAFLAILPELRRQQAEEWAKRNGRKRKVSRFEYVYTLKIVDEYHQGWLLTYLRVHERALVNPPVECISVNRKTGETKIGDF